jgi:excisionase family DNA binding protein
MGVTDPLHTVDEVAELLKVHERTLRRWIQRGELAAADLGKKAGYRIPAREIAKFLEQRAVALKDGPQTELGR